MAYDPISGQWRDDSTGLPDMGMPAGMGDFSGGSTQPPPPPQQQRPMPGPGPQLGAPPQSDPMQTLMHPEQANIRPEAVSPELTPGMVNQEWNKINRPQEWDAGHIASTIAGLPLTLPLQAIESIRGLFGGDTIQGWGEQADARYSNPNYSESRAFGVTGVAKEPDYGDRWTGIITGRSQQTAMAGKLMRNEIGRYSKQRSQELKDFKYIGDIYAQGQNLQSNQSKLDFLPEQQQFERNRDVRAGERLQLDRRTSGATATLAELRAGKIRDEDRITKQLADALVADPTLVNDYGRLTKMAEGRLDLVGKAIQNETARRSMPNEMGVPPATRYTTEAGAAVGTADQAARDAKAEQDRAIAAANLEAANARADAAAAQKRAEVLADQFRTSQGDLGKEARDRVAGFYDARTKALQPRTLFGQNEDVLKQRQDLIEEQARVQGFLQSGELPRNDAYAIASGDYDALATPLDQPTPAPTIAPLTPSPAATPAPESPAAVRDRVLKEKMAEVLGGARPTPMATPTPSPSKFVDLNTAPPEATRAAAARTEAELRADFNARFWEPFAGRTAAKSGTLYESKWQGYLRKYGPK